MCKDINVLYSFLIFIFYFENKFMHDNFFSPKLLFWFTFAVSTERKITFAYFAFTTMAPMTSFTIWNTPVKYKDKIYLLDILIIDLQNILIHFFKYISIKDLNYVI